VPLIHTQAPHGTMSDGNMRDGFRVLGLERQETWRAHLGAYEHTRMRLPTP